MEPLTVHRGKVALFDWADVNTDLIIPARYLKRIERTGYGPALFADKRYLPGHIPPVDNPAAGGQPDPAFTLNDPKYAGASILIVGRNFGCGSSREHAVWAVSQGGYRVLIAPGPGEGFADIFEGNAFNNGLLPIELPPDDWTALADAVREAGAPEATVDLIAQMITIDGGPAVSFSIPETARKRLIEGLDAIGETLLHAPAIDAFESSAPAWTLRARV